MQQWRTRVVLMAAAMLQLSCVSWGTQERRMVEVSDAPQGQALVRAREYVSVQHLQRLRERAAAAFPRLSPSDLRAIDLAWQVLDTGRNQRVFVVVTFAGRNQEDAASVADYLGELISDDLPPQPRSDLLSPVGAATTPRSKSAR